MVALDFEPLLALPSKNDALAPVKTKLGRPLGSKNKPKEGSGKLG